MSVTHTLAGLATIAFLSTSASGGLASDKPNLHPLNDELAKQISIYGVKSVFVADFLSSKGDPSAVGWYVADELSENWFHKKPQFRVVDRAVLAETRISAQDLKDADIIGRLGSVLGVDATVTGTTEDERSLERYTYTINLRKTADNSIAFAVSGFIPHCRSLDLLRPIDWHAANRAGADGIGVPKCTHWTVPDYTNRARQANVQGTVILEILISPEGRTQNIRIIKGLGYGLTEKAIETVGEWRFAPVTNPAGVPAAATTNIEVTFRLN